MVADQKCMVSVLKKCKQSSKEAVENLDVFSEFKEYMHIKRPVEIELEKLVLEANNSETSQLILVCGGVGDGKSHIISYLKNRLNFLEQNFILHNDATESFEPKMTSIQTLSEILTEFSDEGLISGGKTKVILAINLGALNNFIDSEEGKLFSNLKCYIEEQKILESTITDNEFNKDSCFQYINFSDHHIFQLTEEGPKSYYIKQILDNIAGSKEGNLFYQAYMNYCKGCPAASKCPIKQNYELLQEEVIQEKIIDLLIQTIIKEKQIISTRALLNFVHDIIVPSVFESFSDSMIINSIVDQSGSEYISSLFPMLMFEKLDASSLHQALNKISPLKLRTERLDSHYIEFRARENPVTLFEENLKMNHLPYVSKELLKNSKWIDSISINLDLKRTLMKLFVYLYYFVPNSEHNCFEDQEYNQYMKYLFYWNNDDVGKLSHLYNSEIRDAIFKWNGEGSGEMIYVQIGQAQTHYRSLQRLEIEPSITHPSGKANNDLFKFLTSMTLFYKPKGKIYSRDIRVEIDLDYSLYCLLVRIRKGYRPNKNDKFRFIKFVEFVDLLCKFGYQKEEIVFEEKNVSQTVRYALKYDSNFNEYKFMEM